MRTVKAQVGEVLWNSWDPRARTFIEQLEEKVKTGQEEIDRLNDYFKVTNQETTRKDPIDTDLSEVHLQISEIQDRVESLTLSFQLMEQSLAELMRGKST